MTFLRCSNVIVGVNVQALKQGLELFCNSITTRLRTDSLSLRPLLNLLSVFVQTGYETDLMPEKSLGSGDDASEYFLICMTQMRRTVA